MKKYILFTLFILANSFAQTKIEKTDGSTISASKVEFLHFKSKLIYWVGKEKEKIDYSEIKSVSNVNFNFRIFPKAKEFKGMFVKAETNNKILAIQHYDKTSARSPIVSDGTAKRVFNFTVKDYPANSAEHILLTVFDKQGNIIESVDLKQGYQKGNIDERIAAYEMIKKNFSDCPSLINELDAFVNKEEDPKKIRFTLYFIQRDENGYLYKYLECN